MYNDIEFRNRSVVEELKRWGNGMPETTGSTGSADAVSISHRDSRMSGLIHCGKATGKEFFAVGVILGAGEFAVCLLKYIDCHGRKDVAF